MPSDVRKVSDFPLSAAKRNRGYTPQGIAQTSKRT